MKKIFLFLSLLFSLNLSATTYYVRPDGDDGHAGTGYAAANAWLTIGHAVITVAAGDIVYIAPGTYRETVALATAGNSGAYITWWGDKEAQFFLDMKPGYVRITGCDTNEISQKAGYVWTCNAKTYQKIYNLVIDGTKSAGSYDGLVTAANCYVYDCVVSGSRYGVSGGNASEYIYRTIASGGSGAFNSCYTLFNCTSNGGVYGFVTCTYLYNCTANGGTNGFQTTAYCYNCTANGCNYGFQGATTYNCVARSCYIGFYGASNTLKIIYGKAIQCDYASYGSSNTNLLNLNSLKYTQCYILSRGGGYDTGTPIEAVYEGWTDVTRLMRIADALKVDLDEKGWSTDLADYYISGVTTPAAAVNYYDSVGTFNGKTLYQSIFKDHLLWYSTGWLGGNYWIIEANATIVPDSTVSNYAKLSGTSQVGTYTNVGTWAGTTVCAANVATVFGENYDILKNPRRLYTGILDCGAYEYSDVNLEWTTYKNTAPAIKISRSGNYSIVVSMKAGKSYKVGVWVYHALDGGSDKPQLLVESSENCLSTNPVTITATGAETTWEYLTTTITPKADGKVRIVFRTRATQTNAYGIFSGVTY